MPTAAKLIACLAFAAVAAFATELYKAVLPEGMAVGLLTQVNAAVAGVSGWAVMGALAGRGYSAAIGTALRTALTATFYVLVIWSGHTMLKRATQLRYDDTPEALQAMMALAAEYVLLGLADPQVPIAWFGGAVLAGCLVEWSARRTC